MSTIIVGWDTSALYSGIKGCWRAKLAENEGINGVGTSRQTALQAFLKTAQSQGFSGDVTEYNVQYEETVNVDATTGSEDFGGTRLIVERCPYCQGRHVHHTRFRDESFNRMAECLQGEYHMVL